MPSWLGGVLAWSGRLGFVPISRHLSSLRRALFNLPDAFLDLSNAFDDHGVAARQSNAEVAAICGAVRREGWAITIVASLSRSVTVEVGARARSLLKTVQTRLSSDSDASLFFEIYTRRDAALGQHRCEVDEVNLRTFMNAQKARRLEEQVALTSALDSLILVRPGTSSR